MSRRWQRIGLLTTTISVRLTPVELAQLDEQRSRRLHGGFSESRGDTLRRLVRESVERFAPTDPPAPDPRQLQLEHGLTVSSSPQSYPAPIPGPVRPERRRRVKPRPAGTRKTGARPTTRKTGTSTGKRPARRAGARSASL